MLDQEVIKGQDFRKLKNEVCQSLRKVVILAKEEVDVMIY